MLGDEPNADYRYLLLRLAYCDPRRVEGEGVCYFCGRLDCHDDDCLWVAARRATGSTIAGVIAEADEPERKDGSKCGEPRGNAVSNSPAARSDKGSGGDR
jgi:hypothetical protein